MAWEQEMVIMEEEDPTEAAPPPGTLRAEAEEAGVRTPWTCCESGACGSSHTCTITPQCLTPVFTGKCWKCSAKDRCLVRLELAVAQLVLRKDCMESWQAERPESRECSEPTRNHLPLGPSPRAEDA